MRIIALPRSNALQSGPTWTFYARLEPMVLDAAQRLWASGQFRSVWVDVGDDPFANGAAGKRVIFNLVERIRPGPPPSALPEPPAGLRAPTPVATATMRRLRSRPQHTWSAPILS